MKEDTLQGMPALTKELAKSPEEMDQGAQGVFNREPPMDAEDEESMINALSQQTEKRDELHPYTQTLTLSDVESCVRLEDETFPPHERCTREKVSRIT